MLTCNFTVLYSRCLIQPVKLRSIFSLLDECSRIVFVFESKHWEKFKFNVWVTLSNILPVVLEPSWSATPNVYFFGGLWSCLFSIVCVYTYFVGWVMYWTWQSLSVVSVIDDVKCCTVYVLVYIWRRMFNDPLLSPLISWCVVCASTYVRTYVGRRMKFEQWAHDISSDLAAVWSTKCNAASSLTGCFSWTHFEEHQLEL